MKNLLKLEELGQFMLSIILFNQLEYAWWVFIVCILMPDLSMIGYFTNTKIGAILYNLFHHKLIAITILSLGLWLQYSPLTLVGIILFGHAAMDRVFGFGLKFEDSFKNTHLGQIG
ncbi:MULTISPECIES: DUF4260 domain-containing protein [Sphingobacterium]|uniref:DUF4260 domain-containing protein n=1 Tax=Sphingobacterium populi TaxID=1812824 RepID=A0ABW5UB37_9SPHI|nr:DUF4260 domain-containing protein [Sphingobacterium sp. CFCC 11742]